MRCVPAPAGVRPACRIARNATTSSVATSTRSASIASAVRRTAIDDRLACDSTPSDAHVVWVPLGIASERISAAAEWAVYSSIITPESLPGESARNGGRPVIRGSSRALTRAAISDADWASALRSESSAAASSASWKLPVGSVLLRLDQRVLGPRVELTRDDLLERPPAPRCVTPSTCGSTRNGYGSWTSRSGASGHQRRAREQLAHARRDGRLPGRRRAPPARGGRARSGRPRAPRTRARRPRASRRAAHERRPTAARRGRP